MDEIQGEIRNLSLAMMESIDGQLALQIIPANGAVEWVLRAHRGTLEKFLEVYADVDASRSLELVSLARNLFENLIWLRLFERDAIYGLLFYRQLLNAQLESQKQAIAKAQEEISLFKEVALLDKPDFTKLKKFFNENLSSEQKAEKIKEVLQLQREKVDEIVRHQFSLYAEQAKMNGYEFQSHLIEKKAIPQHQQRISIIEQHLDALNVQCSQLPVAHQNDFDKRWNWFSRAESVGMQGHYHFIYSFTSKLLHSTPMSLITPKSLNGQEILMLLDYLYLGIKESHRLIEDFSYPGKLSVIAIQV